uniref:Uncharacterized protein n=1 Tax=Meloidogyne enterolobii TaxID=390850 RepID=A0A6V7TT67_MELEN|nr:unnamed protein product [Meloidogyne enterolobii]
MAYQLGDLALNGKSLYDVITGKENRRLFSNQSGFVLSNVRYLRAFYCVQVGGKKNFKQKDFPESS